MSKTTGIIASGDPTRDVPWEQILKGWARAGAAASRDTAGVIHVHLYALPIVVDGVSEHALLQMRDRRAFHLGLFGGELELWREEVRGAIDRATEGGGGLLTILTDHLATELQEELGLTASLTTLPRTWTTQDIRMPDKNWHILNLAVPLILRGKSATRMKFPLLRSMTASAADAKHFGQETLAVIPVRLRRPANHALMGVGSACAFQPFHFELATAVLIATAASNDAAAAAAAASS